MHFLAIFLDFLESFSVGAVVFLISLSMYLSHANGVSITDQRTLKLSTIVLSLYVVPSVDVKTMFLTYKFK